MKFRKKPIVVEARQWAPPRSESATTNREELAGWLRWLPSTVGLVGDSLSIKTLEGVMVVQPGDWIIKGMAGEFYPCKDDIFAATYEQVGD